MGVTNLALNDNRRGIHHGSVQRASSTHNPRQQQKYSRTCIHQQSADRHSAPTSKSEFPAISANRSSSTRLKTFHHRRASSASPFSHPCWILLFIVALAAILAATATVEAKSLKQQYFKDDDDEEEKRGNRFTGMGTESPRAVHAVYFSTTTLPPPKPAPTTADPTLAAFIGKLRPIASLDASTKPSRLQHHDIPHSSSRHEEHLGGRYSSAPGSDGESRQPPSRSSVESAAGTLVTARAGDRYQNLKILDGTTTVDTFYKAPQLLPDRGRHFQEDVGADELSTELSFAKAVSSTPATAHKPPAIHPFRQNLRDFVYDTKPPTHLTPRITEIATIPTTESSRNDAVKVPAADKSKGRFVVASIQADSEVRRKVYKIVGGPSRKHGHQSMLPGLSLEPVAQSVSREHLHFAQQPKQGRPESSSATARVRQETFRSPPVGNADDDRRSGSREYVALEVSPSMSRTSPSFSSSVGSKRDDGDFDTVQQADIVEQAASDNEDYSAGRSGGMNADEKDVRHRLGSVGSMAGSLEVASQGRKQQQQMLVTAGSTKRPRDKEVLDEVVIQGEPSPSGSGNRNGSQSTHRSPKTGDNVIARIKGTSRNRGESSKSSGGRKKLASLLDYSSDDSRRPLLAAFPTWRREKIITIEVTETPRLLEMGAGIPLEEVTMRDAALERQTPIHTSLTGSQHQHVHYDKEHQGQWRSEGITYKHRQHDPGGSSRKTSHGRVHRPLENMDDTDENRSGSSASVEKNQKGTGGDSSTGGTSFKDNGDAEQQYRPTARGRARFQHSGISDGSRRVSRPRLQQAPKKQQYAGNNYKTAFHRESAEHASNGDRNLIANAGAGGGCEERQKEVDTYMVDEEIPSVPLQQRLQDFPPTQARKTTVPSGFASGGGGFSRQQQEAASRVHSASALCLAPLNGHLWSGEESTNKNGRDGESSTSFSTIMNPGNLAKMQVPIPQLLMESGAGQKPAVGTNARSGQLESSGVISGDTRDHPPASKGAAFTLAWAGNDRPRIQALTPGVNAAGMSLAAESNNMVMQRKAEPIPPSAHDSASAILTGQVFQHPMPAFNVTNRAGNSAAGAAAPEGDQFGRMLNFNGNDIVHFWASGNPPYNQVPIKYDFASSLGSAAADGYKIITSTTTQNTPEAESFPGTRDFFSTAPVADWNISSTVISADDVPSPTTTILSAPGWPDKTQSTSSQRSISSNTTSGYSSKSTDGTSTLIESEESENNEPGVLTTCVLVPTPWPITACYAVQLQENNPTVASSAVTRKQYIKTIHKMRHPETYATEEATVQPRQGKTRPVSTTSYPPVGKRRKLRTTTRSKKLHSRFKEAISSEEVAQGEPAPVTTSARTTKWTTAASTSSYSTQTRRTTPSTRPSTTEAIRRFDPSTSSSWSPRTSYYSSATSSSSPATLFTYLFPKRPIWVMSSTPATTALPYWITTRRMTATHPPITWSTQSSSRRKSFWTTRPTSSTQFAFKKTIWLLPSTLPVTHSTSSSMQTTPKKAAVWIYSTTRPRVRTNSERHKSTTGTGDADVHYFRHSTSRRSTAGTPSSSTAALTKANAIAVVLGRTRLWQSPRTKVPLETSSSRRRTTTSPVSRLHQHSKHSRLMGSLGSKLQASLQSVRRVTQYQTSSNEHTLPVSPMEISSTGTKDALFAHHQHGTTIADKTLAGTISRAEAATKRQAPEPSAATDADGSKNAAGNHHGHQHTASDNSRTVATTTDLPSSGKGALGISETLKSYVPPDDFEITASPMVNTTGTAFELADDISDDLITLQRQISELSERLAHVDVDLLAHETASTAPSVRPISYSSEASRTTSSTNLDSEKQTSSSSVITASPSSPSGVVSKLDQQGNPSESEAADRRSRTKITGIAKRMRRSWLNNPLSMDYLGEDVAPIDTRQHHTRHSHGSQ